MCDLSGVTEHLQLSDKRGPLVLQPLENARDLRAFTEENRAGINARLLSHGAILFRGFNVNSIEAFDGFVGALDERRAEYIYRSTPRTHLANGIYTATEYPADREIPLHNENAYQRQWPLKLSLCCLTPATSGGETPIADMAEVTASIAPPILDSFRTRGVRYTRTYHADFDLSWQEVFQTEDREAVSSFCTQNAISHTWLDDRTLQTVQTCQGTARHPITGAETFFNQAHLFHVSSLGEEMSEFMIDAFGKDKLPRHATFGDGGEIDEADLKQITRAFSDAALTFKWQRGDIILLDNMQFAHGRSKFTGKRQVVASLLNIYDSTGD